MFAKNGASVTIHGRSTQGLQETIKLIEAAGVPSSKVLTIEGTIENEQVQKDLINKTIEKFGRLDVLVNNAGIVQKAQNIDIRSMENFDYIFNVNVRAPIAITELAIPHLEKTKGNIVNVSSSLAKKTAAFAPFYSISKAGLDHFTRNYAAILAPLDIRINSVNPGVTDTNFASRMGLTGEIYKKVKEERVKTIPLKRYGNPKEMAEFVYFVASEKGSYMTGQTVVVDGGVAITSVRNPEVK